MMSICFHFDIVQEEFRGKALKENGRQSNQEF